MSAKYIFRCDDICHNMNWDNFNKLEQIFDHYGVKPVIGVIPNNKNGSLLRLPAYEGDFWQKIRQFQDKGWEIALHGYEHVFYTKNSGLLRINKYSEFAGLPYDEQSKKIKNGLEILKKQNIHCTTFMAPAHSFDKNTLKALKENGISKLTDGYGLYPAKINGLLHVPQLTAMPKKMLFGVYTFCLHPSNMNKAQIVATEKFIKENSRDIIAFQDSLNFQKSSIFYIFSSLFLGGLLILLRRLRG